ncbi:DUF2177 family protein [soil metagenome]
MTPLQIIITYFLTLVVFLALDLLWLGVVAKKFYRDALSKLLSDKPNWTAAIIFYFLFIVGVFVFAIVPAIEQYDVWGAIKLGALFGFFTYATYDLTNLALLKDWPMKIVIVDIIWGTFLTGAVGGSGYLIFYWVV